MEYKTSKLNIVPLQKEHREAAAALLIERYRAGRRDNPLWPDGYQTAAELEPLFGYRKEEQVNVAALVDGRVTGFMTSLPIEPFGLPVVYLPDWGHAAAPPERGYIYRRMYAELSRYWVGKGYLKHAFFAFPDERDVLDALFHSGFGMNGIDAVRDLSPVPVKNNGVKIRRADLKDIDVLMEMRRKLSAHLRRPPVFAFVPGSAVEAGAEEFRKQIEDGKNAVFLAEENGKAIGVMRAGPPSLEEFKMPVYDEKTCAISMAYTEENRREKGIATALLNAVLAWAKETGRVRCTVDFESGNIPGSRFWLKHFRPAGYNLARYVEERSYRYMREEQDGK